MIGNFKRFDMDRKPKRQSAFLTPVIWAASFPKTFKHKARIDKSKMPENIKPPYFLLCNHNAFMDFKVMTRAIFPHRASYVVAIDGFVGIEWVLRAIGGICIRKFVKSVSLVKNMMYACKHYDVLTLFPEARYSLCGTQSVLPNSIGKMIKKMNVPVVTFIMHGHHINSPFWHIKNRKVKPIQSEMTLLLTKEETQELPVDEINKRLADAFVYDDYAWQKENNIRVKYKKRAEGLHKVLYQCPACKVEYKMSSSGIYLKCNACGKIWEMTELGELNALSSETEFSHIPDWYEWERANVREEVESGTYAFKKTVRIESLPNSKGFIVFDKPGELTHNMDGFTLTGEYEKELFSLTWTAPSLYSCHIEYNFKGRGQCVDLSTSSDTFYCYPDGDDFAVTKLALATEELYRHFVNQPNGTRRGASPTAPNNSVCLH